MNISQFSSRKRLAAAALLMFVFLAGIIAGMMIEKNIIWKDKKTVPLRERGHRLTNPLLDCTGADETIGDPEIRPFREKILEIVDRDISSGRVKDVSVLFRDLNNGPTFGIRTDDKFCPASLLKVPIMMAYLKIAESNPEILKKTFKYDQAGSDNSLEYFKPSDPIRKGRSYTVEELIRRMIAYSDNDAKNILIKNLNPVIYTKVFADLGVHRDRPGDPPDFITTKEYAAFFRMLFNSSYLNREMSEKALQYLSEVEFKPALAAGVPKRIEIAHKFGEYSTDGAPPLKQIHDCGIVYYPNSPYLLCVMTKGERFEELTAVIAEISKASFEEIEANERIKNSVPAR